MQENDNIKSGKPQSTEHGAAELEKTVKKAQKREHKPTVKKQALTPSGKFRNILAAALVLCLGLAGFIIFILTNDTTPPAIQKVSISDIIEDSAVVTWQTDEPATSQVKILDSNVSISTELDKTLVANHSATLTDLKPNTRYRFMLISKDKRGNEAKLEIELTTPSQPYVPPMVISEVKTSNITDFSATIIWQTNRPATSQVEYGETESYGSIASTSNEPTTKHSITLMELKPNTSYHFMVKSEDADGKAAASEDQTFITLSTTAAAVEVGIEIGKRAPDFTLPTLDGKELSLNQLRGKTVMVNFWKSSCSECAKEMPDMQAVFDKWSRDDLEILAVNMGERAAFVQSFFDSRGLTFPALLDSDEAISKMYQVSTTPTTFFINADGIISEIKEGSFTNEPEIERTLKSL
ncbi:MAG: redoxin domain-containing protein [Chloroflexota bacterium]|nr:MAG: redoxin domain-containing protein [Chloroflexota bacterium]